MAKRILRVASDETWQRVVELARKQLGYVVDSQPLPRQSQDQMLERAAFGPPPPEADPAWLFTPHPYPEIRRVLLTPEMCAKLLDRNGFNRRLIPGDVATFGRVMLQKMWYFTDHGMSVNNEGNLMNGQHRAAASVMTGVTLDVPMFVGMPQRNFVHLDSGRSRTYVHVGQVRHLANATNLGSVVRLVMQVRQWHGATHLRVKQLRITNEEYDRVLMSSEHDIFVAGVKLAARGYGYSRMSVAALGAAYCLFREAGAPHDAAELFLDNLTHDRFTDVASPSARLYRYLMGKLNNRERVPPVHQLGMILKAWNNTLIGKRGGSPAFPSTVGEMFPEPHSWSDRTEGDWM